MTEYNKLNPKSVSVVVPVYNEKENLPAFIGRTMEVLDGLGCPVELILVDDGSRDGSPAIISEAAKQHPGRITGIFFNRNYGQHTAVIAGLSESRGEIVVTLDADLQNPPEEIPKLVAKADEGYDVVGTVRVGRQDSPFRKLFSWLINQVTAKTTGVRMKDYGCMLRAYSRPVVDAILQCPERSTFIPVLANTFADKTAEIEVAHAERPAGESKYNILKLINLQFDLLTSMTTFPLRLLSFIGAIISLIGIGFGLFLLIMRLLAGPDWAAQGVFTLFAILFFFVGAQFIAMGLIGEYVGRIYQEARGRPRYFVRERVGASSLPDIKINSST
ncbi:MAG: glycosyltransferase [Candidatus Euphemobacter frigidus]|nr:glycosyltransferase [Candidatus Euphemobacter frigidus]MDP8275486.1 glycosyltransferase [Candidatus Euphemobacter frigidus]